MSILQAKEICESTALTLPANCCKCMLICREFSNTVRTNRRNGMEKRLNVKTRFWNCHLKHNELTSVLETDY